MSNASASAETPVSETPVIQTPFSVPEVRQITDLLDLALRLPEGQLRTNLVNAIREVLVDYLSRAAVAVFLEDNPKYVPTEVMEQKRSA